MNKYLNNINKIIKNQDTNYISAIIVSLLSALILHGYIRIPYIFTTKIFNFFYLLFIGFVGKYNLYLALIISILFLIINSINKLETFIDDDGEEEEESEEESDSSEESEDKEKEKDDDESKKISIKIKKKSDTNCNHICDDDKICLKNCYRQLDTSDQELNKSSKSESDEDGDKDTDKNDDKDADEDDFEDQISAFELAKEKLISNIKKNKK